MIPALSAAAPLDMAEAVFGRVAPQRDGGGAPAIKSRVAFEDCTVSSPDPWFEADIVPLLLSAPKVTAFQHNLTQDGRRDPRELTTYLTGDTTTIRGHKPRLDALFWMPVCPQDHGSQLPQNVMH